MLHLVKPQRIINKDSLPTGWSQAATAELKGNPWLRLVVEGVCRNGSRREFPDREAVKAFAQENPNINFQTILADGGECPAGYVWFFARREGCQDFDAPLGLGERLGKMRWLLKHRRDVA